MAVSKRLRYEILRRDNHACRYCGAVAPDVPLTVDHVVPTALGGSDDPSNLVTACRDCNGGKSASPPDAALVEDVAADSLRWARAIDGATAIRSEQLRRDDDQLEQFEAIWTKYWLGAADATPEHREHLPRETSWRDKVRSLLRAGLDIPFLAHAVEVAMYARGVDPENRWRYFCGVCWREVTRRQEIARELLHVDDTTR